MSGPLDLRLYAIVDPEHAGGRSLPELASMVAAGGATLMQLRDKVSNTRDLTALAARELRAVIDAALAQRQPSARTARHSPRGGAGA